jgi:hypothetical protein
MPVSGTNPCEQARKVAQRPDRQALLIEWFSELVRSVMLRLHFHRLFLNCYNSVVDYGV